VMTWAMIGRIISVIILSVLPRTMKCEAYRFHLPRGPSVQLTLAAARDRTSNLPGTTNLQSHFVLKRSLER
jgi:hypothetical protein